MKDSALRSVAVLAVIGAGGLVAVIVGAVAMNRYDAVAQQLPFAVSGVMGGLAMLGFSLGVIAIQMSRRAAATERRVFDAMLRHCAKWLAVARVEGTE